MDSVVKRSIRCIAYKEAKKEESLYGKHEKVFKKHKDQAESSKILVDTIDLEHDKAYTAAAEAHLRDEKKRIIYDRLNEGEIQRKFVDTMVSHYVTKAREYFETKKQDPFTDHILMRAYSGVTKDYLTKIVKEQRGNFKKSLFTAQVKPQLMRQVSDQLESVVDGELTDEMRESLVKYVGMDDKIDHNRLTSEDVSTLLREYHEKGTITSEYLKGRSFVKKKKEAKK